MNTNTLKVVIEANLIDKGIDTLKRKYKEANTYDKKRYDKWTKENKESSWNKLNNPLFNVQDKHGTTIAGGALKGAALSGGIMIPFGPTLTGLGAATGAVQGAIGAALNRYGNKRNFGKHWKEEK